MKGVSSKFQQRNAPTLISNAFDPSDTSTTPPATSTTTTTKTISSSTPLSTTSSSKPPHPLEPPLLYRSTTLQVVPIASNEQPKRLKGSSMYTSSAPTVEPAVRHLIYPSPGSGTPKCLPIAARRVPGQVEGLQFDTTVCPDGMENVLDDVSASRSRRQIHQNPAQDRMFYEYGGEYELEYADDTDFPDDTFDLYDDTQYYYGQLYRDVRHHQPKRILNPRDNRHFPGLVSAGIGGISPKLRVFITGHVKNVAYDVQGPPPASHEDYVDDTDDHFP